MNDRIAFLDAILDNPGEDTIRLAFADWLDDQTHPGGMGEAADGDRAKLIRWQILLRQNPELWQCTDCSASWCPACGDCCCPDPEERMDFHGCPLHAPESPHDCKHHEKTARMWESVRVCGVLGLSPSSVYTELQSPTASRVSSHSGAMQLETIATWDRGFLSRIVTTVAAFFAHAPKHAEALALVREVELTDLPRSTPTDGICGVFTDHEGGDLTGMRLPMGVYDLLTGHTCERQISRLLWPEKLYKTQQDAISAASIACAAWARSLCRTPVTA